MAELDLKDTEVCFNLISNVLAEQKLSRQDHGALVQALQTVRDASPPKRVEAVKSDKG